MLTTLSILLEGGSTANGGQTNNISSYILLGGIAVLLVVMFVLSSRRNKKKEEETKQMLDAIAPGNKVKTIGGICGIVVEVDKEENTFVLQTGTETTGKSYIKFDKQAVYQTDAKAPSKENKKEEKKEEVKETKEEAKTEETATVNGEEIK